MRRAKLSVVRPLAEFLRTETAGGVVLVVAAAVALAWANSPWQTSYETLWGTRVTIRVGSYLISEDLRHWVNDGLMALFFFVVGLEIKRELLTGELRERRAAALPVMAALGGMVVPALLYLALNASGPEARGWGIPMATDIAFAVGLLSISLAPVAPALKAFLLALAIVDDIGAILVIALFYTGGISLGWLAVAIGLLGLILVMLRFDFHWGAVYVIVGLGVWFATFESGVHATIAGVALGLITPARALERPRTVSDEAHRIADETADDPVPPDVDAHLWLRLSRLSSQAISPLARLETVLHPWTSFVVVPLFALANAGITLSSSLVVEAARSSVAHGVILGLVVGKPLGIVLGAWIGTRTGLARLSGGIDWRDLTSVGVIGGVGFTVSLFISHLALSNAVQRDAATLGILVGSALAGAVGWVLLSFWRQREGSGRSSYEESKGRTG
ncbi:MAG TPA: Na+/H+ antiporter NhaA [Actinomycetota bacterium]|nr:Na+/H+ antiporter NhaA [Actinomycetota bacterium]